MVFAAPPENPPNRVEEGDGGDGESLSVHAHRAGKVFGPGGLREALHALEPGRGGGRRRGCKCPGDDVGTLFFESFGLGR